jgi:transcription antitermination factor NusG
MWLKQNAWQSSCFYERRAGAKGVLNFMQYTHLLTESEFATQASPPEDRRWLALSVAPRHEKKVSCQLEQKGYETFLPLYRRLHQYGRRTREFQLPLFPGYLFCRAAPNEGLPVLTTPGVFQFLGAGKTPTPIDEDEIAAIQIAARVGLPMEPHGYWEKGQRVRIARGPLSGLEGMVADLKKPLRLVLSITIIQRSVLVEIDTDCVVDAGDAIRERRIAAA